MASLLHQAILWWAAPRRVFFGDTEKQRGIVFIYLSCTDRKLPFAPGVAVSSVV